MHKEKQLQDVPASAFSRVWNRTFIPKLNNKHMLKWQNSDDGILLKCNKLHNHCGGERVVSLSGGTLAFFLPTPTFSELMCVCVFFVFFLLCMHVSPRHGHSINSEPCGREALSCQLWSTLRRPGAAAQDYDQGLRQPDCRMLRETHLIANGHQLPTTHILPS